MFETETFRLHVVERPDPAEVLGWMGEGTVRLRLPVPKRRVQLGPVAWSLDSTVVLDVRVSDGRVDRAQTKGRLEPPVRLPLGFEVDRLHLSPRGDLILELGGLPDLNLSALIPWLPRVPTHLRDLGQQLAERARAERRSAEGGSREDGSEPPAKAPSEPVEPPRPGLEVDARAVRPLLGVVMDLGAAGRLELSPSSQLDLRYAERRLTCQGTLNVEGGELSGPKFHADGLRSSGRVSWERKRSFELSDLTVTADHLQWSHQDEAWRLVDVELESDRLVFRRTDGGYTLEGELAITGKPEPIEGERGERVLASAEASVEGPPRTVTLTVELAGTGIRRVK